MKKPTLTLTHPEASRERLLALARNIPGAYIGIKIAALLLILEGQRPGGISRGLGITRQSLNLLMHRVNDQGLISLKPIHRPGRPPRLTPKIRQKLKKQLEKSPLDFGINNHRWNGPALVIHLKRRLGISLKIRQAQNWMYQLGYRLKRTNDSNLRVQPKKPRDPPIGDQNCSP